MRRILLLLPLLAALAQDSGVIRSSVTLVPVTVSINDKNGRPIDDVKASELTLLDNGRPREIRYFSQDFNAPLTVGLIADTSGSQREFFEQHSSALKQFIGQVLRPADKGFLVSVGFRGTTDVQMIRDLTGSIEDLQSGINNLDRRGPPIPQFGDPCLIPDCRGTPLWNGIFSAVDLRMRGIEGRKAFVVLSDGIDSGSQHTLDETIEAAQAADTPVYTIQTSKFNAALFISGKSSRGGRDLRRIANETGGRPFGDSDDGYGKVFAQIESELRNLYVLTFAVPETDLDGKFHKLEVRTSRKGLRVRARAGYVAR